MVLLNEIPEDLLLSIFEFHVWSNCDSPHRLLRVCRRWHTVTLGASSLWGDILLCDSDDHELESGHNTWEMKNKIFCGSAHSLTLAIERTKGSHFELTVILYSSKFTEEVWETLPAAWIQERCRALSLLDGNVDWMVNNLKRLPALKRLEMDPKINLSFSGFESLLTTVKRTSRRLWYLRILAPENQTWISRGNSRFHVNQYTYPVFDLNQVLDGETSITTLEIISTPLVTLSKPLIAPLPSLYRLCVKNISLQSFSPHIYSTLTHLSLQYDYGRQDAVPLIHFPQLRYLTIHSWNTLSKIQAPDLHSLILRGGGGIGQLPHYTVLPKKLDLDLGVDEIDFRWSLWAWDIWSQVEDLQVVYIGKGRSLWRTLSEALHGEKGLFPNLRKVVVLSPKRSTMRQAMSEALLQRVVDTRRSSGVLNCARYGWYNPEDAAEDPRESRISWVDMEL